MSSVALLVRMGASLHPHSGLGDPPRYGDFEAQRHWMEVTTNLPIGEWYVNSSRNDLEHWGLDYPPLSAYQSYVHGRAVSFVRPASVALGSSVGAEDDATRALLRATVLLSDLLLYFPAAIWAVYEVVCSAAVEVGRGGVGGGYSGGLVSSSSAVPAALRSLALVLLSPALITMDHGHFQYNCISLGLALAAIAAIVHGDRLLARGNRRRWLGISLWHLVGSAFFSLSLNHKQISLFLAPAFFAHLLGTACRWGEPEATEGAGKTESAGEPAGETLAQRQKGRGGPSLPSRVGSAVASVALLGAVVVATFALCWLPLYLAAPPAAAFVDADAAVAAAGATSPPSPSLGSGGAANVLAALRRVFPTSRGIFEDYVSNLWCATQPAFRWKRRLGGPRGPAATAGVVLAAAALPLAAAARAPSSRRFLLALLSSSLAFYLFGYQVHEKSILLALLPAALLQGTEEMGRGCARQGSAEAGDERRGAGRWLALRQLPLWLHLIALVSLVPLIERDADLIVAGAATVVLAATWAGLRAFADEGCDDAATAIQTSQPPSARPAIKTPGEIGEISIQRNRRVRSLLLSLQLASAAGSAALVLSRRIVRPPATLPFFHDLLLSAFCFLHFFGAFLWTAATLLGGK